ncbi:MAG: hypothetical protein EXS59_02270 [Candidatus Taylorbacteria bacterium]|nr:hypothetical protein [Candidatus Taylorbacteria bacterium]
MKPTIFVSIDSHEKTNPIQQVLNHVMKALGAEPLEQLVQGEVEATIAVTNSVATALRWVKETESTSIVVTFLSRKDLEGGKALADRFPGRINAVPMVCAVEGEMEIVPFLMKLVAEKSKEVKS